jgi:hypothetical protein
MKKKQRVHSPPSRKITLNKSVENDEEIIIEQKQKTFIIIPKPLEKIDYSSWTKDGII